ncbi:helix-turn-helix domain-containing protein [Neobacillus drentensis]|uniref:helix-turn-helix transcriptional regulator n=1 Tax=Neobacillus drentensis TaxID=220684 RepID=UPI0030007866
MRSLYTGSNLGNNMNASKPAASKPKNTIYSIKQNTSEKGNKALFVELIVEVTSMPVNNRLKDIRHDHRMNQTEFSEFLGISIYQYNRYEKEARQPTLEIALQISEKVKRPVNDIFYLTEEAPS